MSSFISHCQTQPLCTESAEWLSLLGGGIHACLGAQLATTMMKVLAIYLLHRFDWQGLGDADFVQFPLKIIKDSYQIQLISR
jgi:Cytochrome P450